ncbi:MAG: 16S rRNA (cytosine(1402)-N(4))-methyltransferase RsmH [Candidatus Omnitrophica bacterium]|nr:16S rRNA (cytosine(1402)-N(4))-methyltransferase RsmH [Candidatus Omnitrophota bacterium]
MENEVIEYLSPQPGKVYVDATCGSGGHAKKILEQTNGRCFLLGIDKDRNALKRAEERLKEFSESFIIIEGGFENMDSIIKMTGKEKIDGILFDLGFSTEEISEKERGFSFLLEGPLDMRYSKENHLTAGKIINSYSMQELIKIFREYGEFRNPEKLVQKIIERRRKSPFKTTTEFADFISRIYRSGKKKIHPATLFFQSLRIAVNNEIENLKTGLGRAWGLLNENGRIVVISFHSLEDRVVKNFLRSREDIKILTKKPVIATELEILLNPMARSAKMRAGEKQ